LRPKEHNNLNILERKYAYNTHSTVQRVSSSAYTRPNPDLPALRTGLGPKDTVLPSIERPIDTTPENQGRTDSFEAIRRPQVMYKGIKDDMRFQPVRPTVTYVDSWADSQPKRRRTVLSDNSAIIPVSSNNGDDFVRIVSTSRVAQPSAREPSLRYVGDVRRLDDRNDLPLRSNDRPDFPGYKQRDSGMRERNYPPPAMDSHGYTVDDRQRHIVIDDDSPPLVRVIRRVPEARQTLAGNQLPPEPPVCRIQRTETQQYHDNPRPTMSIDKRSSENVRPVDPNQPGLRQVSSSQQQWVDDTRSTSLSTFPSHPHPHEIKSGLVSYPILSRSEQPQDSRFSSVRNEPLLVSSSSSYQFPQRFAVDEFKRNA
jgi:hypothetical protein